MGQNSEIIKVDELSLNFGGVAALCNVSISVGKSEILAVIGPNGAGKSCLLNCINGFYRPQKGNIYFQNREITRLKPHKIAAMGISRTFQGLQVFSGLNTIDNLLTGRHLYTRSNAFLDFFYHFGAKKKEIRERRKVEEIIDFLEIKSVRHRMVGSLSYGLRKRIDLGRALAMDPKIILMDEPMAGMNLEEKEDIARFIIDIREAMDIPIVIIEHDMQVVMDIADRIYVLEWGNVIAEGTPESVKNNPAVIKAYLGE